MIFQIFFISGGTDACRLNSTITHYELRISRCHDGSWGDDGVFGDGHAWHDDGICPDADIALHSHGKPFEQCLVGGSDVGAHSCGGQSDVRSEEDVVANPNLRIVFQGKTCTGMDMTAEVRMTAPGGVEGCLDLAVRSYLRQQSCQQEIPSTHL